MATTKRRDDVLTVAMIEESVAQARSIATEKRTLADQIIRILPQLDWEGLTAVQLAVNARCFKIATALRNAE